MATSDLTPLETEPSTSRSPGRPLCLRTASALVPLISFGCKHRAKCVLLFFCFVFPSREDTATVANKQLPKKSLLSRDQSRPGSPPGGRFGLNCTQSQQQHQNSSVNTIYNKNRGRVVFFFIYHFCFFVFFLQTHIEVLKKTQQKGTEVNSQRL